MNKYQEALDKLKENYENVFKASIIERDNEFYEDMDALQELVEKATPKKVIYSDYEEVDDDIYVANTAKCPTCGNEFEFGYWNDTYNHHCVCGQVIDWSKEDE